MLSTISRKESQKYLISDSKTKTLNYKEKFPSKKEKITRKCVPAIFTAHSKESPKNPVFTAAFTSQVIKLSPQPLAKYKNCKKTMSSIVSLILKEEVRKMKMMNRMKTPLKSLKRFPKLIQSKIPLNLKQNFPSPKDKNYQSQNQNPFLIM